MLDELNIRRHKKRLLEILLESEPIICYALEELLEKMSVIQGDYHLSCIIHILTNDGANICQKHWSDDKKEMELLSLVAAMSI